MRVKEIQTLKKKINWESLFCLVGFKEFLKLNPDSKLKSGVPLKERGVLEWYWDVGRIMWEEVQTQLATVGKFIKSTFLSSLLSSY